MSYKNEYLSVSRLKKYDCPLAFKLHYIDKHEPDAKQVALSFGTVLHEALEAIYAWVVAQEHTGLIPADIATDAFRKAWQKSQLGDLALYNEGLRLIRQYCYGAGEVDHMRIIGIEVPFKIKVEEFDVVGAIDRVDKVDDQKVRIIDYKSNRILFSEEELESDLQMSVYGLVALEKWPWVKRVEFEFHMLRHDRPLRTTRTVEQLQDARDFVVLQGRKTEQATEYPAVIGANCIYCDHSSACPEYQAAIRLDSRQIVPLNDSQGLVELIEERMRSAALEKLFKSRKDKIDDQLRQHLENQQEIDIDGYIVRYDTWQPPWTQSKYDTSKAIDVVSRMSGLEPRDVAVWLCSVDRQKFDTFFSWLGEQKGRGRASLVRAELEVLEQRPPPSNRLKVAAPKGDRRKRLPMLSRPGVGEAGYVAPGDSAAALTAKQPVDAAANQNGRRQKKKNDVESFDID